MVEGGNRGGGTNRNIGTNGGVRATMVDMRQDCRVGVERKIEWPGVGVGRKAKTTTTTMDTTTTVDGDGGSGCGEGSDSDEQRWCQGRGR